MIDNIKSQYDEETVQECIQCVSGELTIDAVGLWQFVPDGKHKFGLSGENLLTFIRRCLLALLRKGARPIFGFAGPPPGWRVTERFGYRPEEIADRVIAEWLAVGAPEPRIQGPDPGQPDIIGLWFATPNFYEEGGKPAPQPPPDLASARDKWGGRTVDEWIADRLRELDVTAVGPNDPVGMWLIVPAGRYDFGLQGEVLVAFVRRTVLALLRAGAMPVTRDDAPVGWRVLEEYGRNPDEIADAVIAEWLASGGGDPDDKVWFARPDRIRPEHN
jgi:hypothetical protein